MKTKIRIAALAAVCCAMSYIGLADVELSASSGPIVPGEWNSHFLEGKKYAEDNKVPMVVFWANPGCSYCEKLEKAVQKDDFVAWMKSSGYVFVFAYGTSGENKDAYLFAGKHLSHYPFVAVYYYKDGDWKMTNFSGRSTTMPSSTGSTLQQKFINSIEYVIKGNAGQSVDPGTDPSTDPVSSAWSHARTFNLVAETGGRYIATVLAKLGKANKSKKNASVTVTIQPLGGKKIRMTGKVPANESPFTLNKSGYTLVMSVTDSGKVEGTFKGNGYDLTIVSNPVNFGGKTDANRFTLENVPTMYGSYPILTEFLGDVVFTTSGTKWSFSKAGKVTWKNGVFVNSNMDNACGVKLTYKSSAGSFSGKLTIYAQTGEKKVKKISAKVTGLVVDGIGYGIATAKGLPDIYVGVVGPEQVANAGGAE